MKLLLSTSDGNPYQLSSRVKPAPPKNLNNELLPDLEGPINNIHLFVFIFEHKNYLDLSRIEMNYEQSVIFSIDPPFIYKKL